MKKVARISDCCAEQEATDMSLSNQLPIHGWNNDRMKYFLSFFGDVAHSPIGTCPQRPPLGKDQHNPRPSTSCIFDSGECGNAAAAVRAQEGLLWLYPSAGTGKEGKPSL